MHLNLYFVSKKESEKRNLRLQKVCNIKNVDVIILI